MLTSMFFHFIYICVCVCTNSTRRDKVWATGLYGYASTVFCCPPLSTRCVDIRFDRLLLPVQASGPSTHRSSINNSITVRANYQTLPFNRVVPCDSIPNTVIIVLRETIVSTVGEHPSDFFHGEVVPPFSIAPAEYSNRNGRFRISVSCVIHIINRFIGSFFSTMHIRCRTI